MGNRFAPLVTDVDGMLPFSIGTGVPATPTGFQGFQIDPGGAIYASTSEAIDHYHAGLPFAATGRLCVGAGPVASRDQGVPFNAAGRVAFTGASPVVGYRDQGVSFVADGTLAVK